MSTFEMSIDEIVNKTISNLSLAGHRVYSIKGVPYVDLKGAVSLLGKSKQTIYRKIKSEKDYPKKHSFEGVTIFSIREIVEYQNRVDSA